MRKLALLVLATVACTVEPGYDRSNPFDPRSPYPMQIVGIPDTADARGARFTAVIQRDPPINVAAASIKWEATDLRTGSLWGEQPPPSSLVIPLTGGEFLVSQALTSEMVTTAIGARFNDEVVVGRNIVVGQRARTLTLACGTVATPAACDASPLAVGAALAVRSSALDAGGSTLSALQHAMARAIVASRNPLVAVPTAIPNGAGMYSITAIGGGSTWVVITVDFATDSVRVVVNP